jgi:hypothetical protein
MGSKIEKIGTSWSERIEDTEESGMTGERNRAEERE